MITDEQVNSCFIFYLVVKFVFLFINLIGLIMIKIYGMDTCPDCTYVKEQVAGNSDYEIIDIGQHVKSLKAFLKLRDNNPVFDNARKYGFVGIPCFVLEDGTVTLDPEDVGLHLRSLTESPSCNIDGSGC